jgi:hypothetical protein
VKGEGDSEAHWAGRQGLAEALPRRMAFAATDLRAKAAAIPFTDTVA